ncbi:hypothetical protein [Terasakiella pusilla]|uniref:hypothetical protein n=1 Tax=Terasakiella pusilla TaxID=64973 RepID=UPI003AA8DA90
MMRRNLIITALMLGTVALGLTACKKEPEPPKVQAPVKIEFNAKTALPKLEKRISTQNIDASPLSRDADYIQLSSHFETASQDITPLLGDIVSDDTVSVIFMAHVKNGDDLKFPPVPLFIFDRKEKSWATSYQAKGTLTPLFVERRAPFTLSLEMILLKDKLDGLTKDAEAIVQAYSQKHALYSATRLGELSKRADDFSQRIALVEEASLKDVATFNISYLENFGTSLDLKGKTGETVIQSILSVSGQNSVLPLHHNEPPSYSALLTHKIGDQSARLALGDLENGFWRVPAEALHPTCKAIQGALSERLGLSRKDGAIVLWRMMQPHALFADEIDYRAQCSGEDLAVLLTEAGFTLPPAQAVRPSNATEKAMNRTLSKIATLLKNTKDQNLAQIVELMKDQVVVRDQARLLFSNAPDQLIDSQEELIAPSMDREEAAEYLMMLPVKAYGCYSRGQGQVGSHRATLLTLENDPNLWYLNMGFDEENKVSGFQLRRADQLDFCRAIGGRTGANRCTFSGTSFPGLEHERCG